MDKFPSAKEIVEKAKSKNLKVNINQLHGLTYKLMMEYKDIYYRDKVADFFNRPSISELSSEVKNKIGSELLKPMKGGDIVYGNFMEEASRRISQTFQSISGNIAELCVENELLNAGLKIKINYERKKEHTDIIIYYPRMSNYTKKHRVEIKNVSLRERGTRGLGFDGDSMLGFFNDSTEFTDENIGLINNYCKKTSGYCYVPPAIIKDLGIKIKGKRFKSNETFIIDIKNFIKTGLLGSPEI